MFSITLGACGEDPPDPVCGNGEVEDGEACDDGNRDDGDGCDANCEVEAPPPGDGSCDPDAIRAVPRFGEYRGTTEGAPADQGASCGGGAGSSEVVYAFRLAAAGTVCLSTEGSRFDTVLHVRTTCADADSEAACNDDGGPGTTSQMDFDAAAQTTYFVFVDGFGGGSSGDYVFSITLGACGAQNGPDRLRAPWGGGPFSYYAGRSFFVNNNHLGADVELAEGTPVLAGVEGRLVIYRASQGYGELVAVIEVDLGEELEFENAYGDAVRTRHVLWILGHLRKSRDRGGAQLPWQVGDRVSHGDVIGYINDDVHNGDGAEHVHIGLRLQSMADAQRVDAAAWFRGYEGGTNFGIYYADAIDAIERY